MKEQFISPESDGRELVPESTKLSKLAIQGKIDKVIGQAPATVSTIDAIRVEH